MSRKVTTGTFIQRAREIHGSKYDYSKVVYIKATSPVVIICPEHGEFLQTPNKHLIGRGCRRCADPNYGLTTQEFIAKCKDIHGNKYNYSKTVYKNYKQAVQIICPEHGEFAICACQHLYGHGCQRCGKSGRYTTAEFIVKHKSIHGDKYDYSKTNLDNRKDGLICVICPQHGEYYKNTTSHFHEGCPKCTSPHLGLTQEQFLEIVKNVHGEKYTYENTLYKGIYEKIHVTCRRHGDIIVTPNNFMRGHGCKKCAVEEQANLRKKRAASDFESKAREVHGEKYDYSKVNYQSARTPVCITCPEHGDFYQDPNHHLSGCGCPKCTQRSWAYTTAEFIKLAKDEHGDRYDYSETQYINNHTNVKVICKEHGSFEISPSYHMNGGNCPVCTALKIESRQESEMRHFLERHSIQYEREKQFPWLRRGRVMPLDFYLPEYNIAIECQGLQHFKSHVFFGGTNGLKDIQDRDNLKRNLCKENDVTLLYYSDLKISYPYEVYENFESLLKRIQGTSSTIRIAQQLSFDFES
ncbi:MAG: hypothetical protein KBS75_08410 [Bacteroidales bacterium]|nr:hypothetical protein [Candidatus Equimonas faecalis]